MQERYWRFLIQLKAEGVYCGKYVETSEYWDNAISVFAALVTSGIVAGWAIWKTLDWLWAVLVMFNQALAATKQFLPFKKRIAPLGKVAQMYEMLFIEAENRWFDVAEGNLTNAEINSLLTSLKKQQHEAWTKCIGDLTIPICKRVRERADALTAEYFSQTYKVSTEISK